MSARFLARLSFVALLLPIAAARILAADSVSGTFTVQGKTVRFTQIYTTIEREAEGPGREHLVLVADAPVAPADRAPDRLLALSKAGTVRAVRMRWVSGTDQVLVVPYHQQIPQSGRAFSSFVILDITRLNDKGVEATFESKMLGQEWNFKAIVKATPVKGGVVVLEPEGDPTIETPGTPAAGDSAATAIKRQLGAKKYQFTPDAFFHAIADGDAEAVDLFLKAGMSPNTQNDQRHYALNYSTLFCASNGPKATAVIVALARAKADAKNKSPEGQTVLISALQSCSVDAIDALVKAGADVSAKAPSGMTALALAEIFQRADVADLLRKAGAK
jgi:hypothetical protein